MGSQDPSLKRLGEREYQTAGLWRPKWPRPQPHPLEAGCWAVASWILYQPGSSPNPAQRCSLQGVGTRFDFLVSRPRPGCQASFLDQLGLGRPAYGLHPFRALLLPGAVWVPAALTRWWGRLPSCCLPQGLSWEASPTQPKVWL